MSTGHKIFIAVVLVLAMAMIAAMMFRHHGEVRRASYHSSTELPEATAKDVAVAAVAPATITNAQIFVCLITLNFKPLGAMTNEQLCWTIILAALAIGWVSNFVQDLARAIRRKR